MTRVAETRASLFLVAAPDARDVLAARAEVLARHWADALDGDALVCCRVRDSAADFAGTHFAALVPELAAFDVALDAWREGERAPDTEAVGRRP